MIDAQIPLLGHGPVAVTRRADSDGTDTVAVTAAGRTQLGIVSDGLIGWTDQIGIHGGYVRIDGRRISDPNALVFLWELRAAGLIRIASPARSPKAGPLEVWHVALSQRGQGFLDSVSPKPAKIRSTAPAGAVA